MRMLLRHWLLLALLLIGAPLIGACEVNCKSDKDKTIGERVDEIGEEAEEAVEEAGDEAEEAIEDMKE